MTVWEANASGTKITANALSWYFEDSLRLVLEQFSHCELPARCTGVVWQSLLDIP